MDRRRFLRTGLRVSAIGLGAGTVGLGGLVAANQPRRHRVPARAADDAQRPISAATRKPVVVVGGGLAGLVSAIDLALRNFDVTLVEQAPHLGGKAGGWPIRALGEQFPLEHGFHGFFAQYYNLTQVLRDAGVQPGLTTTASDPQFVDAPDYPILFARGPTEVFGRTTTLFPLNLLQVVMQSRRMRARDFMNNSDGLLEMLRYDPVSTPARFDDVDFARFIEQGRINRPMAETILLPFAKTTLNRPDRLSAAEAIRFFHFYFMGNPDGLRFSLTHRDMMTVVIDPLRRRLESLGGRVRVGTAARRLLRGPDGVHKVVVDADPRPAPPVRVPLSRLSNLGPGPHLIDAAGLPVFVSRQPDGFRALDGRCTHMGCTVAPLPEGGFRCPCHGGAFDADGRPTAGPPVRPLRPITVAPDGDELLLGGGAPLTEEALPCSYCVVACEVRGLRQLLRDSDYLGDGDLRRGVAAHGEAHPYAVLRLWLDRPTAPRRPVFYTTSGFRYTDSLALYSLFQEPYISWARRTGGAVIESHAYALREEDLHPQLKDGMLAELRQMLPELAGARILHDEFQLQSNFSRFAPGDHARRPTTETAVPNLLLAGDHIRHDLPVALMEAAATTGHLSANAILRREGLREIPIWTVSPRGPAL